MMRGISCDQLTGDQMQYGDGRFKDKKRVYQVNFTPIY